MFYFNLRKNGIGWKISYIVVLYVLQVEAAKDNKVITLSNPLKTLRNYNCGSHFILKTSTYGLLNLSVKDEKSKVNTFSYK